jgi:hypothetical protein
MLNKIIGKIRERTSPVKIEVKPVPPPQPRNAKIGDVYETSNGTRYILAAGNASVVAIGLKSGTRCGERPVTDSGCIPGQTVLDLFGGNPKFVGRFGDNGLEMPFLDQAVAKTYQIGDVFKTRYGHAFLAQVSYSEVSLIGLGTANRFGGPVKVGRVFHITEEEFSKTHDNSNAVHPVHVGRLAVTE